MSVHKTPTRLALALAALIGCAGAQAGNRVDLNIIDRSDQVPLDEYHRRGETWVEGTPGHVYTVQLVNRSNDRVLVVLSVDGVNVITGDRASYGQSGYVLEPYQTTEIDGWRKSMHESAQFYFTSVPDSYAGRTGRPENVGVIGAAVFSEKYVAPVRAYNPAIANSRRAAPAPQTEMSKSADASAQGLGTGHGAIQHSAVSRTRFERASSRPDEVVAIRYDKRARLVALGLLPPRHGSANYGTPQPFPGFVPDPPR